MGVRGLFVGPSALEMPLSFEGVRAAGTALGSGVVLVYDETSDLMTPCRVSPSSSVTVAADSVPCRIGTVRQDELLHRLRHPGPRERPSQASELVLLKELGQAMRDASICGLGQTASSAIESAFALSLGLPGGQRA